MNMAIRLLKAGGWHLQSSDGGPAGALLPCHMLHHLRAPAHQLCVPAAPHQERPPCLQLPLSLPVAGPAIVSQAPAHIKMRCVGRYVGRRTSQSADGGGCPSDLAARQASRAHARRHRTLRHLGDPATQKHSLRFELPPIRRKTRRIAARHAKLAHPPLQARALPASAGRWAALAAAETGRQLLRAGEALRQLMLL